MTFPVGLPTACGSNLPNLVGLANPGNFINSNLTSDDYESKYCSSAMLEAETDVVIKSSLVGSASLVCYSLRVGEGLRG